jgi:uncharacterized cupredoxin-like copper-binding protein
MNFFQTTSNQTFNPPLRRAALALLAATAFAGAAHAHGPAGHGNTAKPAGHAAHHGAPEQKPWGIAGEAKNARRTIEIRMSDDMRFSPNEITVKLGETVRLVAVNAGKVLHEIVIGTPEELKTHAELMKKHPNMEHDEPYMAHVDPGQRGEIVWTFNRPGNFEFACLIPGHFEAGMTGRILVQR